MDRVPLAEEVPDLDEDLDEDPWADNVEEDLNFDENPQRQYEPEFTIYEDDEETEDDDDEADG